MNDQLIAALITAGASLLVAGAGALVAIRRSRTRKSDETSRALVINRLKFVDVAVDARSQNWRDDSTPHGRVRVPEPNEARWCIAKSDFDEGADLPIRATLLNTGDSPIVVSRIGIKVIKAHNSWYSGVYYGTAPRARPIESSGHYDLRLDSARDVATRVGAVMNLDPDSAEADQWYEIGALCAIALPKPMYLPVAAPFSYTTNLKRYDKGMPTEAVLRLWVHTDSGELLSDDVLVTFGR
ncbi:hypothetical protein [Mycobacterium sp.]|uniref:hypothetical protein n=1 Tax=Mycobacterium sp. TaxID=1785 RepID=UPI003D0D9FFC